MRKLFTLLFCLLIGGTVFSQINTYPYNQDFELFGTCGTSCGNACLLNPAYFWTNDTGDDQDWTVDVGGTGSSNTGPGVDHNPGTFSGKYLYTETSGCNNNTANLISPWFDFTNVVTPAVDFWYHMQGATMGTMHFDVDTTRGTGPWVQDVVAPWTDNQNLWQLQSILLCAYGGRDSVRFRIRAITGTSFTSDMAIDDVTVYEAPASPNVGVLSIDSLPPFGCGLGVENVTVTIGNFGPVITAGNAIPVSFTDGTTSAMDTLNLTADLGCGETIQYTFSTTIDFSTPGTYIVQAWTSVATDSIVGDDSSSVTVTSVPIVASLPYLEDFESGNGGWTVLGTNASWQYGSFTGSVFGLPPTCGEFGWGTNLAGLYNNNENSYIQSPCFDFSGLTTDPSIRFLHWYNTENGFDENWVDASTDGGATWNRVGSAGTGLNWYNDPTNQWWENIGPGWQPAENVLTGLAGQSQVLIRIFLSTDGSVSRPGVGIDDILIYDAASGFVEAGPVGLLAPVSSCGLGAADTLIGQFSNNGADTLFNVPFCYSINNGPFVCDTFPGPVFPGDTVTHAFSQTGDFSAVGLYEIVLTAAIPGDLNGCNDTVLAFVENILTISTFPYREDFENGGGGWVSGGANSSWAFGTPAKTIIQGAGSGQNAWVTGGLGTGLYNNNEGSFVISPCFDMTNAPANLWVTLKINYDLELSWDGANLQFTTDGGATWTDVGTFGPPSNNPDWFWYTDNTVNGSPGGSQNGWSDQVNLGWITAKHPLDTNLVGQPQVRFRINMGSDGSVTNDGIAFDDFALTTPTQVSLGPDTTVCGGSFIGTNFGMMGQSWNWSTGDTGPMAQVINTDTAAIVETVTILYYDDYGFCSRDTALITVDPAPFVDLVDTTVCVGDMATLDASGAGSEVSYLWSTNDTASSIMAGAGVYGVTLAQSGFTCTYTDSVEVAEHPGVNFAMDTMPFCAGDTFSLDAGISPGTYLWSTGDTLQVITGSMAGTYSVSVTDTFGCVSIDTISTTTEAPAELGANTLLCDGVAVTLDAGIATGTFVWSTGDTTATISVSTAGTYSVDVTSALGCVSSDSIEITTAVTPVAAFTADTSANCTTYVFTDNSTGTPTSYAWDFGNGDNSTMASPSGIVYDTNGVYTVTLITTNDCGSDTITQDITISCIVGIEELLPAGSVSIYPNPNAGNFFVTLEGLSGNEGIIEVYNLYGQVIETLDLGTVQGDRTASVVLNNAAKGAYFVKVSVDGKFSYQRIMVQ